MYCLSQEGEEAPLKHLGCDAVLSCGWLLVFWRNISPQYLNLKMGAVHFSETLVTTHKTTQYHNPQYHNSDITAVFCIVSLMLYLVINDIFISTL